MDVYCTCFLYACHVQLNKKNTSNCIHSSNLPNVCGLWRHLAHHCGRRRWRRLCQETKVLRHKVCFVVCNFTDILIKFVNVTTADSRGGHMGHV